MSFYYFQVKSELYVKTLKDIYLNIEKALPPVVTKNEISVPVKEEINE